MNTFTLCYLFVTAYIVLFLPPANEVCEGYVFTGVCLSTGGCAWLLPGRGMRGCSGGAWLLGGHVWLLPGGMHGCSGGVHGCSGGACMVALGACVVAQGGVRGFFDEIRSFSGRYASYWNAFSLNDANTTILVK